MVAVAQNGVIGKDNKLPWHLPKDLPYFKKTTMGKPIVMGRKTYESIGRPLPGRTNIVMSRQQLQLPEGVVLFDASVSKLGYTADTEVMIIGGAEIYNHFMPLAHKLYLTKVHANVAGDTHFFYNTANWQLTEQHDHYADESNPYDYSFCVYERKQVEE